MTGSHSLQWLGLILLAAILLQTIAVAISFMYFSNVLTTMKETFSKSSISCLMRTNLRSKGFDFNADGEQDDPCWQVTQQLHFLIEKTMSNCFEREISSAVKDEMSRVLPSLKESQPAEEPLSRRVPGQKIRSWESERGLAFSHNIKMTNGELVVPQGGLYYIYAQTYFRHTLVLEEDEDEEEHTEGSSVRGKQMLQYVYKKVSSYPVPILLMKNARTTCWSRNTEYGLYSIYQAGVFQLAAGDRVFVSVSNATTVDMDEKSSFFGAFLVSQ
ncbi:hypothetical protein GJAV_G00084250 [Gymnothorax javanicus]|nr:hypothetical protein GJAV_G00084250 [Gymnothorax javanicus]